MQNLKSHALGGKAGNISEVIYITVATCRENDDAAATSVTDTEEEESKSISSGLQNLFAKIASKKTDFQCSSN